MVHAWITHTGSNNTVRNRLSTIRTFSTWAVRNGYMNDNPTVDLGYITKQYPKTYGKVQAKYPARWLTRDQAFGDLIGACETGTAIGIRDEIVIRLGLAGMRAAEIGNLTVAEATNPDEIRWLGKGRKPRTIVPGKNLTQAIGRYLKTWGKETGTPPQPTDRLLCRSRIGGDAATGSQGATIEWGTPVGGKMVHFTVTTRARAAGLGHVAPHDLRRTAAGILHHSTGDDGSHNFDLLDIQKVLGHADPATTMRSYLDPMDTDVQGRAAGVLD